ncbi:MAG: D-alanyl-D-alanine carboxypeptidase, partial [Tateyamaria sp.]
MSAFAAPPTASLRPRARGGDHFKKAVADPQAIIAQARLGGRVCYAVADARTGAQLEGGNAKVGVPPASVAKAVTALYALSVLGATHR